MSALDEQIIRRQIEGLNEELHFQKQLLDDFTREEDNIPFLLGVSYNDLSIGNLHSALSSLYNVDWKLINFTEAIGTKVDTVKSLTQIGDNAQRNTRFIIYNFPFSEIKSNNLKDKIDSDESTNYQRACHNACLLLDAPCRDFEPDHGQDGFSKRMIRNNVGFLAVLTLDEYRGYHLPHQNIRRPTFLFGPELFKSLLQ